MADDWWIPKDMDDPRMVELLRRRMAAAERRMREVMRPVIDEMIERGSGADPLLIAALDEADARRSC